MSDLTADEIAQLGRRGRASALPAPLQAGRRVEAHEQRGARAAAAGCGRVQPQVRGVGARPRGTHGGTYQHLRVDK